MRYFKLFFIKPFLFLCVAALLCCHGHHHGAFAAESESGIYRVVATTFPVFLFTKNVCADAKNTKVDLLVPAVAGCPHDYSLSPADLQKLASADVLVINGWGLEDFLEKAIHKIAPKLKIIDAGKTVPVLEEEDDEINPHIFAAPKQAALMVINIAKGLAENNPEYADLYRANALRYRDSLENLSNRLQKIGASAKNKKIALEHDALSYLAANAGLEIVAMVEGNTSANSLLQLSKTLKAKQPALLAGDSQFSDRILKTLAQETGLPFAQLDPCASGPENAPLDFYQTTMDNNIKILGKYFE